MNANTFPVTHGHLIVTMGCFFTNEIVSIPTFLSLELRGWKDDRGRDVRVWAIMDYYAN